MNEGSQNQQSVYIVKPVSPETEGAATTALWLEIIFGFFSLLGIGHVYTGRIALGILLMIGWWAFIGIAGAISAATLGIAACCFVPLYIAVPILSGIQARTFMQKKGGAGSWTSVAGIAGGGCLLIIIAVVAVMSLGVLGSLASQWQY